MHLSPLILSMIQKINQYLAKNVFRTKNSQSVGKKRSTYIKAKDSHPLCVCRCQITITYSLLCKYKYANIGRKALLFLFYSRVCFSGTAQVKTQKVSRNFQPEPVRTWRHQSRKKNIAAFFCSLVFNSDVTRKTENAIFENGRKERKTLAMMMMMMFREAQLEPPRNATQRLPDLPRISSRLPVNH